MRKLSWLIPLSLLLPPDAAWAQAYPGKPVRIVIGFAAGCSVDLVVRTMAQNLGESLQDALQKLASMSTADLLKARLDRLMAYGRVREQA